MKRKIAVILLISTMMLSLMTINGTVFAAGPADFRLDLSALSINPGGQVIVTVNGQNLTNLVSYEVHIGFDPSKLTYVSGSAESNLQDGNPVVQPSSNEIIIAFAKSENGKTESGNLSLCSLTFSGSAVGTANITLKSVSVISLGATNTQKDYTLGNSYSVSINNNVAVTGVSLDNTSLSLAAGTTRQLTETVAPSNATNKKVTWSSDNTSVATVDTNGKVSAVAAGNAKITVTTQDGNHTATCVVAVTEGNGGNGGNGGGGGGGNTTTIPEPPKNDGKDKQLTIEVKTDDTGTAKVEVKPSDIQSIIDKTVGGTITIQVKPTEGTKEVSVNIPVQQVKAAGEKQDKIAVDTGLAIVSFTPDTLKSSIGTDSSNLQLSVAKVDVATLPEEVRKVAGNSTVYNFNLSVDGNKVSSFNSESSSVVVGVNFTLPAGGASGKVVVYYIDDNNKLQVVKNGKYNSATGKVDFKPKHFSKYFAAYVDSTFGDIANVSWAKDSIEALAARGIVNGVGGNAFNPDNKVTRAEFIKMLMYAFDLNNDSAKTSLSDVKEGTWYYSSIAAAQSLGIVKGKSDGSFGINDEITRQDMAVMAYRTALIIKANLDGSASTSDFADKSDISAYAIDGVTAMQKAGVISGVGQGNFAPKSQTTRAQAATIIYRTFNLVD